jgi:phospholipase C
MRSSPHWESSLLLVLYDEHGGYYDHVAPPYVRPAKTSQQQGDTTTTTRCGPAFDFSVLGPRVPAVFVSPLIERRQPPVRPRSDEQYFAHESFILTLAKVRPERPSTCVCVHSPLA